MFGAKKWIFSQFLSATIAPSSKNSLTCPCACPKNNPILIIKARFSQMLTSNRYGAYETINLQTQCKVFDKIVKAKLWFIRSIQSQVDANQDSIRCYFPGNHLKIISALGWTDQRSCIYTFSPKFMETVVIYKRRGGQPNSHTRVASTSRRLTCQKILPKFITQGV